MSVVYKEYEEADLKDITKLAGVTILVEEIEDGRQADIDELMQLSDDIIMKLLTLITKINAVEKEK
jgi:hypothetical protein